MLEQIQFNPVIKILRFFGSEMTDGTVDELQTRMNGTAADLLDFFRIADTFNVGIRTEFQINFIGIINHFLREIITDQFRQHAAYLCGQ